MKKNIIILLFSLLMAVSCVVYIPYPYDEGPPPEEEGYYEEDYRDYSLGLDVSYFYEYLSPHGIWVSHSPYGYVWIPQIDRYGWRPYTYGRWVWTDFGWTWISQFKWGWTPFHYGRWGWDEYLGWFWVPNNVWGPAWVTWRKGSHYIGWAPIPPEVRFVKGIGIRSLPFSLHGSYWVFVEGRNFYDARLYRYVLPRERNLIIINYTIVKTNIVVRDNRIINSGIDIDHIQRVSRQKISKHELQDASRPGQSKVRIGKLEVYRPTVKINEAAKPERVVTKTEAKAAISKSRLRKFDNESSYREEARVKEAQVREVRLLERSQKVEENELKRKLEEYIKNVESKTEKKKVEKEYKGKIERLKKQHLEEKSQIKKRHKKEEEQVKKKKIKKKKDN